MKENKISEPEMIQIIWMAVISTVDVINARPDQVEVQALRAIKVCLSFHPWFLLSFSYIVI